MSDGEINLALLQYKSEVGSGVPPDGPASITSASSATTCRRSRSRSRQAGGKFFFDLGDPEDEGFERKFKDPNGIVFDINWKGWQLTKDEGEERQGRPAAGKPKRRSARRNAQRRRGRRSARRPAGRLQEGQEEVDAGLKLGCREGMT